MSLASGRASSYPASCCLGWMAFWFRTTLFAAMLRPFQADSAETLWCLLCCVVLELCRRADLTGVGAAPTRCLPAAQKRELPTSAAGLEVPPTASSTSVHATLLKIGS